MLPRIRQLAINRYQKHPWKDLSDMAILQSAGLYAKDLETGQALTPGNIEPDSKYPLIADFFRNIGLADELGAGVRNLYKYTPRYSGKPPEIIDGDIFKIVVPLDDSYSFDVEANKAQNSHRHNHFEQT